MKTLKLQTKNLYLAELVKVSKQPSAVQMRDQKQDKQCTYIVTMRRFRATIVVVEKRRVLLTLSVCL